MKVAEAIKEKSRLKKTVSELREKLEQAVSEEPQTDENPKKLLLKLEECLRRMEYLAAAVYRTNDMTRVNGKTMTQLIYARDTMFFRLELYKDLIRQAENPENRFPADLSVSELQNKADRMRREIRTLNGLIQNTNRTTELEE